MYFLVTVKVETDDVKGKTKKRSEKYLVEAYTVTEAEARTHQYMEDQGSGLPFEITSAVQSKVNTVVSPECTPEVYNLATSLRIPSI